MSVKNPIKVDLDYPLHLYWTDVVVREIDQIAESESPFLPLLNLTHQALAFLRSLSESKKEKRR